MFAILKLAIFCTITFIIILKAIWINYKYQMFCFHQIDRLHDFFDFLKFKATLS